MHKKSAERNLLLLPILNFLSCFRTYEGITAVYFAAVSGSFATGMAVLAILNLSASFFEMPTGVFSDRIGRKKTLIIYHLGAMSGAILYYLAPNALVLFLGAIIHGFSLAMRSGAVSAYVYENLEVLGKKELFKSSEGHRQAMGRYALMTAGIFGSAVIFFYDIRSAILITVLVQFAGVILSFSLADIHSRNPATSNTYFGMRDAWNLFRTDHLLRNISLGQIIAQGGGNVEYRFRAILFSLIMPDWLVNLLGILNNLLTGMSMKLTHAIVGRIGFRRALLHTGIYDRLATFILVIINTIPGYFVMSCVSSVVFGLRQIAAEDLLQTRYLSSHRATMGSLIGLGSGLIYGISGIIIGMAADRIGVINTMLVLQPILFVSVFFFHRATVAIKNSSIQNP